MPPTQKSIVWTLFKKSADNKFAACKLCSQKLKYFLSTSNLKQHILRKHKIQYDKELRKKIMACDENADVVDLDNSYPDRGSTHDSVRAPQPEFCCASSDTTTTNVIDMGRVVKQGGYEAKRGVFAHPI
ncbi:hypothetical protein ABEB36_014707 [Hypothenemus hampei]|uniref:BED-type domain-containing protein n=1 Tax=Hypothenemus hampei TaxID=57062 RepID=A0ABD1E3J8_HYPHA